MFCGKPDCKWVHCRSQTSDAKATSTLISELIQEQFDIVKPPQAVFNLKTTWTNYTVVRTYALFGFKRADITINHWKPRSYTITSHEPEFKAEFTYLHELMNYLTAAHVLNT